MSVDDALEAQIATLKATGRELEQIVGDGEVRESLLRLASQFLHDAEHYAANGDEETARLALSHAAQLVATISRLVEKFGPGLRVVDSGRAERNVRRTR